MSKTPEDFVKEKLVQLVPKAYDIKINVLSTTMDNVALNIQSESIPSIEYLTNFVGFNCSSAERTARGVAEFTKSINRTLSITTEVTMGHEISAEVGIDSTKLAAKTSLQFKIAGSFTTTESETVKIQIPYEEKIAKGKKLWLVAGVMKTQIQGQIKGEFKVVASVTYKDDLPLWANVFESDPEYTVKVIVKIPFSGQLDTDLYTFFHGFKDKDIDCETLEIPEPPLPFDKSVGATGSLPGGTLPKIKKDESLKEPITIPKKEENTKTPHSHKN